MTRLVSAVACMRLLGGIVRGELVLPLSLTRHVEHGQAHQPTRQQILQQERRLVPYPPPSGIGCEGVPRTDRTLIDGRGAEGYGRQASPPPAEVQRDSG